MPETPVTNTVLFTSTETEPTAPVAERPVTETSLLTPTVPTAPVPATIRTEVALHRAETLSTGPTTTRR